MKLSEITQKPQLIEVLLDDTEIVEEFGEELIFYTWDRQPLEIFMQLANLTVDADNNNGIIDIVRKLILDNKGKEIISSLRRRITIIEKMLSGMLGWLAAACWMLLHGCCCSWLLLLLAHGC